jgi:type VI secretion system protein ImpA
MISAMHSGGVTEGVEFTDSFQKIDGMVSAFDANGDGPLRKGEQPFRWSFVEELARPLAELAPDLRVGVWLLRSGLACRGLDGLVEGMSRLADWIERPADQVHPIADGSEHPREFHALVLSWLVTPQFAHAFLSAPLRPAHSLNLGSLAGLEDSNAIRLDDSFDGLVSELRAAREAGRRIDRVLTVEIPDAYQGMGSFLEVLELAIQRLDPPADAPADGAKVSTDSAPNPEIPVLPGTRHDVDRMLKQLINYFRTCEPSHPAPIFLMRVQRMLGCSFEELMDELYQDSQQLVARLERPKAS